MLTPCKFLLATAYDLTYNICVSGVHTENRIGPKGTIAIAEFLEQNTALADLNLDGM